MSIFQIADLTLATTGLDNEFFNTRMKEYFSDTSASPDLTVAYRENSDIQVPYGEFIAKNPFRTYLKRENEYVFYDYLFKSETYVASTFAQLDWSHVDYEMFDVEPLGGTAVNIRSFNGLGEIFKNFILFHNGFVLHASALSYKNNAILFSAPSGTGKSTHTGLWRKYYPDDASVFNDDSPAIRFIDGTPVAYGTPWSGKTNINQNKQYPLRAIVFLEQASENSIVRLSSSEAIFRVFSQVLKPAYSEMTKLAIQHVGKLIDATPIYLLKCRIDREAVDLVKETVFNNATEQKHL